MILTYKNSFICQKELAIELFFPTKYEDELKSYGRNNKKFVKKLFSR